MNLPCPDCRTVYRVDEAKIPPGGVRARCAACGGVFPVQLPSPPTAPTPDDHTPELHQRARHLARALVSEIATRHPERRERGLAEGTLRRDFRDEILRCWEGYAGEVGEELALRTGYFRDALNEILARGTRVF